MQQQLLGMVAVVNRQRQQLTVSTLSVARDVSNAMATTSVAIISGRPASSSVAIANVQVTPSGRPACSSAMTTNI